MNTTLSQRDAGVALATAAADVDVASAAGDLYARMTARDLAGVLRYIPAVGFTEIGPSAPSVHVLKPSAFKAQSLNRAIVEKHITPACSARTAGK